MKEVHLRNLFFAASMEVIKEHRGVLLYVEDYRSLRSAETNQSSRGREQAETSVHSQLVGVLYTEFIQAKMAFSDICYQSIH